MHVPKTAGMSVLQYMQDVYKDRSQLALRWQDKTLFNVSAQEVRDSEYIWLHEPLYRLEFDTRKFFRFTFLRDPSERAASVYLYLRNPDEINRQNFTGVPQDYVNSLRMIEHMSFEEFICSENPYHLGHISNVYGKHFAKHHYEVLPAQNSFIYWSQKVRYFFHNKVTKTIPKNFYLKQCIKRMESEFDYIGLTSTLAEDMNLIQSICFPEYPIPFGNRRVNTSKKDGADLRLSEHASNVLKQKLDIDFFLYDHAIQLRDRNFKKLKVPFNN
jgi:hypothetical protein